MRLVFYLCNVSRISKAFKYVSSRVSSFLKHPSPTNSKEKMFQFYNTSFKLYIFCIYIFFILFSHNTSLASQSYVYCVEEIDCEDIKDCEDLGEFSELLNTVDEFLSLQETTETCQFSDSKSFYSKWTKKTCRYVLKKILSKVLKLKKLSSLDDCAYAISKLKREVDTIYETGLLV
jgi:hypothetical protein